MLSLSLATYALALASPRRAGQLADAVSRVAFILDRAASALCKLEVEIDENINHANGVRGED